MRLLRRKSQLFLFPTHIMSEVDNVYVMSSRGPETQNSVIGPARLTLSSAGVPAIILKI